jgi:hypothetical protein
MRTPPFLLGAALLFWGWQTGLLWVGALMALVLESARFVKERWEFSDDDFSRIWTMCTLLFLAAAVYAFTDNGGPARFSRFLQNPTPSTQTSAGIASARTAAAVFRWLPMFFFLFVAAQAYSPRQEIPWTTLSPILRRRWKRAEKLGRPLPPPRGMNVSYPYLAVCLFAASVHASEDNTYFLGLCALLAWALWSHRTRRFGVGVWVGALAVAFVLGNFGQQGIGRLQSYFQNLDPEWLTRFVHRRGFNLAQSRTALGQIGRVKTSGTIVIRLEPKDGSSAPNYLREATYRLFQSNINAPYWQAGAPKENYDIVLNETNNATTWLLLPGKINAERAYIACYLEGQSRESQAPIGILPLPSGCGRLENLPAFALKKNALGVVLAEGPGLVVFDALYGPGATVDAPFNPAETNVPPLTTGYWLNKGRTITNDPTANPNPDLNVPSVERPALDQIIAELHLKKENPEATLRMINGWFQNQFRYSLWQEPPRTSTRTNPVTPLTRFLLTTRSGHCEYFATATVLLLRELGIPARYAVGYAVHETSGSGFVVRQRDAHAWCLVWSERTQTWHDFDTTPASWVEEESKQASPFQRLSDFWSWLEFEFSKFRWGQSNARQYLLMGLVPVLGVLLYQIFFRRQRHRGKEAPVDSRTLWLGLDSEFYQVERKLEERGLKRAPQEPLSKWLRRVLTDPALAESTDSFRKLLQLHYQYRFDPGGLAKSDREELRQMTKFALEVLERNPLALAKAK